ncbi:MAG: cupin domain-containing protein [Gaiellaceae bacterium]
MRIFHWRDGGRAIDHYGSVAFKHFPLGRSENCARLNCLELAAGGVIGRHPAGGPQLLVVVEGAGMVSGSDGRERPVEAGDAVFWEAGEEHETRSDAGLLAVVLEGEAVEASR